MGTSGRRLVRPWWLLPLGRLHPSWWIGAGAAMIALDYGLGPDTQFPLLYAIPVIVAAWYSGRRPAIALTLAVLVAHIIFLAALWPPAGALSADVATTIFRGMVVLLIGVWFARLAEHERNFSRYVRRLEGLLAICSFCKSIRNKSGEWELLESYISTRTDTQFSHGLCPSCGVEHYPDIFDSDDDVGAGAGAVQ